MNKLTTYRLIILGIGLIAMMMWLIFPENNIISAEAMRSIFLVSLTVSLILSMIEFEIKQEKTTGKNGRYLMYIASVITMAGLLFAVNKVAYSKMVITVGLIGVAISMPLLFINAEKTAEQGNTTGKLSRYLLYITSFILMTGLVFKINKVVYGNMVVSIGLIGITISFVLLFINSEKKGKHNKTMGKLSRYLVYISFIMLMTGLIFRVNKVAYSNTVVYIGLVAFAISMVLKFINAKITAKSNQDTA